MVCNVMSPGWVGADIQGANVRSLPGWYSCGTDPGTRGSAPVRQKTWQTAWSPIGGCPRPTVDFQSVYQMMTTPTSIRIRDETATGRRPVPESDTICDLVILPEEKYLVSWSNYYRLISLFGLIYYANTAYRDESAKWQKLVCYECVNRILVD